MFLLTTCPEAENNVDSQSFYLFQGCPGCYGKSLISADNANTSGAGAVEM